PLHQDFSGRVVVHRSRPTCEINLIFSDHPRMTSPPQDLERYAALLQEAEQIHGISLTRDAWRRLRRNRVAMFSLVFLAVLSLLAILTPFLPLQPPRRVRL